MSETPRPPGLPDQPYAIRSVDQVPRPEQLAEALAQHTRSVEQNPNDRDALFHRATTLQFLKRYDEALADYDRALALDPDFMSAIFNRSSMLQLVGRLEEAIAGYDRVITISPDFVSAIMNRGTALQSLGRSAEALAAYDRVLALQPDHHGGINNRGSVLATLSHYDEALKSFDRLLQLDPGNIGALFNRAVVLQHLDRHEDAIATFDQILARNPAHLDALHNRTGSLVRLECGAEAVATVEKLLTLAPQHVDALKNYAGALVMEHRFDDALKAAGNVIRLEGNEAGSYYTRGRILHEMNRLPEALADYERATALKPDYADAHVNVATVRLALGDYRRGWEEYEWRWRATNSEYMRRNFTQPRWLGREDVKGKTLVLFAEQGLGDAIQFTRYLPYVRALGARVILEMFPPLMPIFSRVADADAVVARGAPLPPYDYQCPLMSLPLALGDRANPVPGLIPYPAADPAKAAVWSRRLGPGDKSLVGLVWAGSLTNQRGKDRSTTLGQLEPLLGQDNVRFIGLQKDLRAGDREILGADRRIEHHGDALTDFGETAALISLLDLVITVDTSVAHLAGALGKPVWVLLRFASDWRWMLSRTDSPWYPTARLFRQPKAGDWETPIKEARAALDKFVAANR